MDAFDAVRGGEGADAVDQVSGDANQVAVKVTIDRAS